MSDEPRDSNKRPKKRPTGNYDVGYCRPPKSTRFASGQSHPRRRAKKQRGILEIFKAVCAEKIKIKDGEKLLTMTQGEAVLFANQRAALQNNYKAVQNVFRMAEEGQLMQTPPGPESMGGYIAVPRPYKSEEEYDEAAKKINEEGARRYRERKTEE